MAGALRAAVLGGLLVAAGAAPAGAPPPALAAPPAQEPAGAEFDALAADLVRFHEQGLFGGGSDQPVTFDEAGARARGFSARALALGRQSAELSNELVAALEAGQAGERADSGLGAAVDAARFPELQGFFAAAARREAAGRAAGVAAEGDEEEFVPLIPEALTLGDEPEAPDAPPDGAGEGVQKTAPAARSAIICGYYPNPKPSRDVDRKTYERDNPAALLKRLGYHETPNQAGGGWTRPQTYQSWACGASTFRDHADVTGPRSLSEQNYKGSPGGEPNPEVYRSGPWPYPDWPAYVYWWHEHRGAD